MSKCFYPKHPLSKLFNKNTMKLSYSCTPNIKSIIASHNHTVINKETERASQERTCNCRVKNNCPMQGNCLMRNIIYQATVTRKDSNQKESYIGLTENRFKTRYGNHLSSFKNEKKKFDTELSKYVWALKKENIEYNISWRIVQQCPSYSNATKRCPLCTTEKFIILCENEKSHTQQANGDHVNLSSSTEISSIKSLAQLKPCDRRLRCYAPKVVPLIVIFISI